MFGIGGYPQARRSVSVIGTLKRVVLSAFLEVGTSVAKFSRPIPEDYALYYNGQWYNKGQIGEVKQDASTLHIPEMAWRNGETLDLEYFYIV